MTVTFSDLSLIHGNTELSRLKEILNKIVGVVKLGSRLESKEAGKSLLQPSSGSTPEFM